MPKIIHKLSCGVVLTLMLNACATYGEPGLRSFNSDYGRSLPTNPKYRIDEIAEGQYSITVHQGSALLSPGRVRARYLNQAAQIIAKDTCGRKSMYTDSLETEVFGDAGWVHIIGTFACIAAAEQGPAVVEPKEKTAASGTGFFVSDSGHIVTAQHVIRGATEIEVQVNGETYPAVVLAQDQANDIAVIKIEVRSAPVLLSYDTIVRKGDEVLTLGFPAVGLLGQKIKATFGRVNATSGPQDDPRYLQVDVPIQPGNSGGPLIDDSGNVIGIIVASISIEAMLRSSGSLPQSVNYAVKSAYISPLVQTFVKDDPVPEEHGDISDLVAKLEVSIVFVLAK